jgi:hypothetical protein
VNYNGSKSVDILTDIYLERSSFSGCVRYTVSVDKEKAFVNSRHHDSASGDRFTEYAIGNGLIISTAFGSGGYYSYPDRTGKPKNSPPPLPLLLPPPKNLLNQSNGPMSRSSDEVIYVSTCYCWIVS